MSFDCLEYFKENIENAKKSAGGNWTGNCPSCGKGPAKFYAQLDPEHEKYGQFICYSCEFRSKSFVRLIALIEDCSPEAARAIYRKHAEVVFVRRAETPETLRARIEGIRKPMELTGDVWEDSDPRTHAELPKEFRPVYDASTGAWSVPEYLTTRGFKRGTLRAWNVGYCERGKFAGRAIIPMECPNGKSFTARDLTGEGFPKYLNPESVDHSLLLFGWHTVTPGADFALVEGPLDAMKMHQHGIPALAFGGKSLSNAQLQLICLYPEETSITVLLDPDAQKEAYGVANQLRIKFSNVFVGKIPPADSKGNKLDPGASTKKQAWKWFDEAEKHVGGNLKKTLSSISESLEKAKRRYG